MNIIPLRYSISSWKQASKCLSNASDKLHITVTEFFDEIHLKGLRVAVEHYKYGTLFAYVVNAQGDIVYGIGDHALSTDEILQQLAQFGFFITWNQNDRVTGPQIEYLLTLLKLGYSKVRVLEVWSVVDGNDVYTRHVVAFNPDKHPEWISTDYYAALKEYAEATMDGSAIDVEMISSAKDFDWSWLTYVANINDIVDDYVEADKNQ